MRTYRRYRAGKRNAKVANPRWYVELRDHDGIPRRFAGFTDRGATEELGRKVARLAELRGAGPERTGDLARYVRLLAHGANPKAAQALVRHSTAELTMSVYARLRPSEERAALHLLPDLLPEDGEAARATGTDAQEAANGGGASGASRGAYRAGRRGTSGDLAGRRTPARIARRAVDTGVVVEDRGVEPLTSTMPL